MSSRTTVFVYGSPDDARAAVLDLKASDIDWKIAVVGPTSSVEIRDRDKSENLWATYVEGDVFLVVATRDEMDADTG